jgi:hypothetical protein
MGTLNPSGLCMCGCGEQAPLAKKPDKRKGHVRGQSVRFVNGHNTRKSPLAYEARGAVWNLFLLAHRRANQEARNEAAS